MVRTQHPIFGPELDWVSGTRYVENGVHRKPLTSWFRPAVSLNSYPREGILRHDPRRKCTSTHLRIRRREKAWPESHQREVRWYQPSDAIAAIEESKLKSLVTAVVVDVVRK